jgi:hypothetical protein
MNRRSLLRAAALGSVAGLAGCGVASRNGVVVDGPGPTAGTGITNTKQQPTPRELQLTAKNLVQSLFSQAAGDPGDATGAKQRWHSYMAKDLVDSLNTTEEVVVVWCDFKSLPELAAVEKPATFRLPVVPLGQLTANGQLLPLSRDSRKSVEVTITVGLLPLDSSKDQAKPDKSLYVLSIDNAPTRGMMLSSDALHMYYLYRNLYFWSGPNCLVPDGRYVPTAWEEPTRTHRMLEWLLAGPSSWLAPAVRRLPENVNVIDNPSTVGQRLVVNLTRQIQTVNLDQLVSQLTWTLLPEAQEISGDPQMSPITVKIESVEKKRGGRYATDNVTAYRTSNRAIEAFAIVDGKVARLQGPVQRQNPPPLLAVAMNKDVEWAAFCRNVNVERPEAAAVVRRINGRPRLYLGPQQNFSSELGLINDNDLGRPETILQPMFADPLNLLVVADGRLYNVQRYTRKVSRSPLLTGVKAFAVPPDGRRIAYIRSGRLYVGALPFDETGSPAASLPNAREIRTILTNLTDVAFTAEDWLAVSGIYAGQHRIVEISLDGGLVGNHRPDVDNGQEDGVWLGGDEKEVGEISSLTAFPDTPYQDLSPTKRVYVTASIDPLKEAPKEALNATSNFGSLTAELVERPQTDKLAIHPFFMQ